MDTFDISTPYGKAFVALVVAIGLMLGYEAFVREEPIVINKPALNLPCEGTPIEVDYPYYGGMLQPHACQQQCEDQIQHYVLYSNGKATQCQRLPGCLDWGEDQGVTCLPPANR